MKLSAFLLYTKNKYHIEREIGLSIVNFKSQERSPEVLAVAMFVYANDSYTSEEIIIQYLRYNLLLSPKDTPMWLFGGNFKYLTVCMDYWEKV